MERPEVQPRSEVRQMRLEAPYVKIMRDILNKDAKAGRHRRSFDMAFDEINRQITGDGSFIYTSSKYQDTKRNPDTKKWEVTGQVKFLGGHLRITPDLIERIAADHQTITGKKIEPKQPEVKVEEESKEDQIKRPEHYIYFVEPSFAPPPDGSAFSALDMAIARFFSEMPKVAAAIRRGEKPPTIDIFIAGSPLGFGGKVTEGFVKAVRGTKDKKPEGFDPYGVIYAEMVQSKLSELAHEYNMPLQDLLNSSRVILQGASKGAITSDATTHYLPSKTRAITERLYDNPGGVQGNRDWGLRNLPIQIARSINLGGGMLTEVLSRYAIGKVDSGAFGIQKKFYADFAQVKGIPEDDEAQRRLKSEMFFKFKHFLGFYNMNRFGLGGGGETRTLAHGTPLDERERTHVRVSRIEPVNSSIKSLAESVGRSEVPQTILDSGHKVVEGVAHVLGRKMKPRPRRALVARQKGKITTFVTANFAHNFPWERSIDSGSWARKMEFVENTPIIETPTPKM